MAQFLCMWVCINCDKGFSMSTAHTYIVYAKIVYHIVSATRVAAGVRSFVFFCDCFCRSETLRKMKRKKNFRFVVSISVCASKYLWVHAVFLSMLRSCSLSRCHLHTLCFFCRFSSLVFGSLIFIYKLFNVRSNNTYTQLHRERECEKLLFWARKMKRNVKKRTHPLAVEDPMKNHTFTPYDVENHCILHSSATHSQNIYNEFIANHSDCKLVRVWNGKGGYGLPFSPSFFSHLVVAVV